MRLDDYTEGRIAEFPAGASGVVPVRSLLTDLNGIWTRTDAAELQINPTDRDKLSLGVQPWGGAGGPRTMRAYSGAAGGQGKSRTSSRYDPRVLSFPLIENTHNKAEKNKLLGIMWPSVSLSGGLAYPKLLAAGFRRSTQSDSRYLLDISDEGSFDNPMRGVQEYALSPVVVKSTWGWYVIPRTATSGTAFTPAGEGPDVIWGCYWTGAISSNITVTITGGGVSTVATFPSPASGSHASPFFCFSPPFKYNSTTSFASVRVPPYLMAGQSYTITLSPGGGTLFYFENYGGI